MLQQNYTSVTSQTIDFNTRVHEYTKKVHSRARARNAFMYNKALTCA